MNEEILLTKKEAAAQLHTTSWSVTRMVNNGSLPVVQVGKQDRIRQSDVDKYISSPVFLPKGRVRTVEAIHDSILTKGAAREKDLLDALHSEPEDLRKARKDALRKAKKKRKRQAKLQQVIGPQHTGSLPGSAKGVFGADITKDGRSTFAVDSPADIRAELVRQIRSENPALRESAQKALTPEIPVRAVDTPEYWRGLAESPLSTAAEKNQYLAKAAQLELETARRTPGFSLSTYTRRG